MGQGRSVLRGDKDDGADDVKRQVDSDDNNQLPIYQLVNVKSGGGRLIDIIKSDAKHSSESFNLVSQVTNSVSTYGTKVG